MDYEPNLPRLENEPESVKSIDLRESSSFPWSGWDVLLLAVLTIVAIIVLSGIGIAVAMQMQGFRNASPVDLARDPRLIVPIQVAAYVVVIGFMVMLVRRGHPRPFWKTISWNFPGGRSLVFVLTGAALAVLIQLSSTVLPIPKQLPIEKFFKDAPSAYVMAVFGITAAPLFEELFFRGFLYPVIARRAGVSVSIVITALLFALLHQSQLGYAWAPLLLLFIVGMVLTTVRARRNSVAASFLIHVGYNLTLFVMLWAATDHFHHLEKAMS